MAALLDIYNLCLVRLGAAALITPEDNTKSAEVLNAVYPAIREAVLADHPWHCAVKRANLTLVGVNPISEAADFGLIHNVAVPLGYKFAYSLPDDCLRCLGLIGGLAGHDWMNADQANDPHNVNPRLRYKIEGGLLLSNVGYTWEGQPACAPPPSGSGRFPSVGSFGDPPPCTPPSPLLKYIALVTDETTYEPGLVSALAWRLAAEVSWALTSDTQLKAELLKEYLMDLSKAKAQNAQEDSAEIAISSTYADARR